MIETVDEGLTGLIEARTPLSCVSEVKHTLGALMYKSVRLQQKHICTNICQIVTPLLCILFTLAVRAIVTGITTGIVKSFSYPVPFNLPILNIVTGPVLSLQCKEAYYYEDADHELGGRLLELQLKSYCEDIKGYSPEFIKKEDVNIAMMGQL